MHAMFFYISYRVQAWHLLEELESMHYMPHWYIHKQMELLPSMQLLSEGQNNETPREW